MADTFTLLPYARPGLMTDTSAPAADAARLGIAISAEALIDGAAQGAAIPLAAALRGPGDVIGIDASAIVASDPDARSGAFEANYFPYVEFAGADFPWRHSLDRDVGNGRMQPWLALVALAADEYEVLPPVDGLPSAIRVLDASSSLPPPADLVFTAHVSLDAAPSGGAAVEAALANRTAGSRARLLCMRKLAENSAYTLFLVPSYELGRLAGLGQVPQASPFDKAAWGAGSEPVDLPVYWSRRFMTNSGEDVEAMVRRLRAINAADNAAIGTQERIFAGDPGYYAGYTKPGAEFLRQSATTDPGAPPPGFDTDGPLTQKLAATLAKAINGETEDATRAAADLGQPVEDPLVTFPAYGWRYREETELDSTRPEAYWFYHLNLDLKFRDAAARGAEVVRRNQDRYMRLSWEQYAGIVAANAQLARLQAAEQLAANLSKRRLSVLEPMTTLALSETVWSVTTGKDGKSTLLDDLAGNGAPASYAGRAMRRLAAKRQRAPGAAAATGGAADGGIRAMPVPSLPGDTDAAGYTAIARAETALRIRAQPLPGLSVEARRGLSDLMGGAYLDALIPATGAVAVAPTSTKALAAPVSLLMAALPKAKAAATVTGLSAQEARTISPVYRGPVISDALADGLRDISIDALIPGLRTMPDNTVTILEENRAFIEAFMAGANHEMNAELRWRGFPTDMRATVFQRFWQRGHAPGDPRANDIDPIHGWARPLGSNPSRSDADQAENLVLIIKGDIVRKIGLPIVEINIAPSASWAPGQGVTHAPVFFGRVGDAVYFGFDVARSAILASATRDRTFMVIYEPPGRMRFGLDVGTQARRLGVRDEATIRRPFPIAALANGRSYAREPVRRPPLALPASPATWDDLSWSHVGVQTSGYVDFSSSPRPSAGPDWWGTGKTSASIARSTWQKPIVAILPLARVL